MALLVALTVIPLGAVLFAVGLGWSYSAARQWEVLATIFTLIGALMVAGAVVALGEGTLNSLVMGR